MRSKWEEEEEEEEAREEKKKRKEEEEEGIGEGECRRQAGRARRELSQILNISDHQSPRRGNIRKYWPLYLFLYRAPIYG